MLNRNFIVILLGNVILGSAMPMLIILGGLAGAWLAPQSWLATVPPSAQMLVGIVVATPISLFMGRFGRRAGFLLGASLIVVGGIVGATALTIQSFILLCTAHVILGGALICINYFRFAAAEAVPNKHQARAISYTLAFGLIAAFIGPELFTYAKDMLAPTPLAGAYLAMSVLGILGALPVLGLNLPAPRPKTHVGQRTSGWHVLKTNPRVAAAIGIAAASQAMMVLLMTPTPLAMIGNGFGEDQAAGVIRWHVIAMFAPGFFTGSLILRFGAEKIAALGLVLLLSSAGVGFSGLELINFYGSLVLLGIGWNFGFIGGTHLLQSALSEDERPLVQGINDTILAVAASAASLLSGALFAGIGWIGLVTLSAPLLGAISLVLLWQNSKLNRAGS